jgi:hypothetical protein
LFAATPGGAGGSGGANDTGDSKAAVTRLWADCRSSQGGHSQGVRECRTEYWRDNPTRSVVVDVHAETGVIKPAMSRRQQVTSGFAGGNGRHRKRGTGKSSRKDATTQRKKMKTESLGSRSAASSFSLSSSAPSLPDPVISILAASSLRRGGFA